MEVTIANLIQIAILLVGLGVTYGVLNQKITNLTEMKKGCDRRFEYIEQGNTTSNRELRKEMKEMSATLNQIVGQLNAFFNLYKKDQKEIQDGH
jgi:hypothetical protein